MRLSRVHFPVTTLGPGRRLGIWFQGCSIRCPGCVATDTWGTGRPPVTLPQLLAHIEPWLDEADGFTLSGGEPFDQFDALLSLLKAIRCRSAADILVYSGYPLERLSSQLEAAQGLIDALISDPYLESADQTMALRGSDNQRLSLLTELGRQRLGCFDRPLTPADKALDLMFDADGTAWLVGIPRRGDLARLSAMLQDQGHPIKTSEHALRRKSGGASQ